jgi:hypothetical protein
MNRSAHEFFFAGVEFVERLLADSEVQGDFINRDFAEPHLQEFVTSVKQNSLSRF